MKQPIFLLLLLPQILIAQTPPWDAARRFTATPGSTIYNTGVAASPDGAAYLTGYFRGTATFDTITLTAPAQNRDYGFLVKLNAGLKAEWGRVFEQKAYDVHIDAQGNVFVAGSFLLTVQSQDSLCYVGKYNAAGQLLGEFTSEGGRGYARIVRTDPAGNCYLAGWMNAPTTFNGLSPGSAGGRDNFLVKLSPALNQVNWAVLTGSSNQLDEVYDMEYSADGFIYTSGNYSQAFNILCFCYNGDFFLEKHDPATGDSKWRRIVSSGSGTSTQEFVSVSPDGQEIFTSGSFKHTATFAPGISLTAETGTDDYHIFVAKYSEAGMAQWAKKVSLVGDSYPEGMVMSADKLVLHGYLLSTALMGTYLLTPQGGAAPFTVQLTSADGTVEAAETFSGSGADRGFGIDSRGGGITVSGNTISNPLTIGNFTLPGNTNSVYVARKFFQAPLSLELSSITHVSCTGAADGSVSAVAMGGTPPYTYQWSNNASTPVIVNLGPGTYTVTVTDQNNGQITATAVITEPPALSVQILNITPDFCTAGGSVSVAASGGTGSVSFIWSNGLSGNEIAGLLAGAYTVTASDASGCTATLQAVVAGGPDTEAPTITGSDITVELGTSGMIMLSETLLQLNITDNCGVATIIMDHNVFDCRDIGPQLVTVVATDESGNSATKVLTVTIIDKTPPVVTCPDNITACPSDNRVEYNAPVATDNCLSMGNAGGQWTLVSGLESGAEFPAGEATLVTYLYTDSSGNAGTCSFEVTIAPAILITLDSVSHDKGGLGLGSISVSVTGSTGPFSFSWSRNGQNVSMEEDPANLVMGSYNLVVTDAKGCTAELSQVVIDNLTATDEPALNAFQIRPNPASARARIIFPEPGASNVHIAVTDASGRVLMHLNAAQYDEIEFDCSVLPPGVYVVSVHTAKGTGRKRLVVQR